MKPRVSVVALGVDPSLDFALLDYRKILVTDDQNSKDQRSRAFGIGLGIALGLPAGMIFGFTLDNMLQGIIFGLSIGMVFAVAFGANWSGKPEDDNYSSNENNDPDKR